MFPFAKVFNDKPYAVVGGVATAAYQPERHTQDIDVLIDADSLPTIRKRLRELGAQRSGELAFPASQLGLHGETWSLAEHAPLDLMWSEAPWATEATQQAHLDASSSRIVPLPYLVLMKMDASRGVDQGDLSRMLGLADDANLDAVRSVIAQHMPDAVEDLESYIEIGRIEVGSTET